MTFRQLAFLLFLGFMAWFVPTMFTYEIFDTSNDRVRELTHDLVDMAATSGRLRNYDYDMFLRDIAVYGEMNVTIKLTRYLSEDAIDPILDKNDILDRKLDEGDRLSILVQQVNPSQHELLLNMGPLALGLEELFYIERRITARSTSPVTKAAKDIVFGYDVISEIESNFADSDVSVFVTTKINSSGKLYVNEHYGDEADEVNPYGANHVAEIAEFRKVVDINPDNTVVINFYQTY